MFASHLVLAHVCTGTAPTPATSAPGLRSPLPHLRRDSGTLGCCFTLRSFAKLYVERMGGGFRDEDLAKRLWGEVFFDDTTRKFSRKARLHSPADSMPCRR